MYPYPQTGPVADPSLAHRRASSTLTLTRPDGTPLADAEVVVEQRCHEFGFAASAFEFIDFVTGDLDEQSHTLHEAVTDQWLQVFNSATLPFYWGDFEPERGRPDTQRLMATATWLKERGVTVKGHPLVWHTLTAPWLDDLSVEEVEQAQRERIRRDVADFAGVIDTWDAINEVVIMPHFDKYPNGITRLCRELGRIETVRLAFDEARAANPSATLLLNDFDLDYGYDALLEGLLAAGIRIDKLGLQTHMHQGYRGEEETLAIIDRFARYGIPIHFTETTLVSGDLMPSHIVDLNDWQVDSWPSTPEGEERQASDLVRHVRTLFSHPAVEAFTYWNIWDLGAWLGAPAGLIRADGTPKPAMEALRALVKDEWWTGPVTLRTDGEGRVAVEGWRGGYAASVAGNEATFTLGSPRIVQARARNGTLRLLTSDEFNPIELHGETTPSQVQTLLANLVRDGATGIRLPLCPSCRTRRVVKVRNEQGQRECFRCAQRRSYGECPDCLRMKKLTATNTDGQRVCQRCGPEGMPTFTCDDCGKTVTTVGRVDGRRVCLNCFPKRLRLCVSCGQEKKIAVNILHGPHCFACHNRILRNPAPCPGCDEKRILAFLGADDLPCCAGCAGQPPRYACRRCGSEEHNYGRLCGKCVLSDRCDDILTGPDGEFLPPMQALRDYLLAQPRPAQIIKWLHMGPSTDLLRDIASARAAIESILDAPRPSKPLIYLRTLLLDSGALPRDAAATRQLMAWATHTIGGASAEHRQMLRTYTRWVLMRRASRDAAGDIAIGAARHLKASLRGLITFLTWTEEQQTPLHALTQAQIEEFITLRTARRWLPQFLTWAAERDITPELDISTLPRREPTISTSEEHLENVIRTLTTDRTIPLDARLAALLIAVYGLPATKTLALRRRQLRDESDGLDLHIGDRPLTLPAPITLLAREQLDLRPDADDDAWLFPGRLPGQPLDPQYLSLRLRPLGTSISALQNTARFRLAGAVPAKVLADVLDFGVATFENYARLAGGTRGDYPALRATAPAIPTGRRR